MASGTSTERSPGLGGRIVAALVAFFAIVTGIITCLQYMSPSPGPIVITVPSPAPAPPAARSDAEAERILEKARNEPLEKAQTDTAAARPAPTAPAPAPPADEPALANPAPPKVAAAIPPPPAKPCIPVGNRIEQPIPVSVGTQLCPTPDGVRATIHDITSFGVVYSVPGWKRETCQRSETCTFYWDGAPQFSIDVVDDADGRHAVLVGAR